jgi:hypothetical protein
MTVDWSCLADQENSDDDDALHKTKSKQLVCSTRPQTDFTPKNRISIFGLQSSKSKTFFSQKADFPT